MEHRIVFRLSFNSFTSQVMCALPGSSALTAAPVVKTVPQGPSSTQLEPWQRPSVYSVPRVTTVEGTGSLQSLISVMQGITVPQE